MGKDKKIIYEKKEEEHEIRPFGLRDKLGYMFGDFGNDFTFIFASSFLMVFYTKVLGISAGIVGTLFLTARCVDAFTDVTMGRIVDVMRPSKNGRFRPWILWMSGPVALASFLMYQSGMASAPMPVKIIYMFVTYILWGSVFYTSINIPYGSMASVISDDPNDRAALSTFRSLGAALASIVIGVGTPMILYTKDEAGNQILDGARMTWIAGIFSVCTIVCYLLCYVMTTERIQKKEVKKQENFIQTVKDLLKNRALWGIITAAIFLLLGQLLTQSMNQYLFADYFRSAKALSLMSFVGMLPTFLLAPFIVKLIQRFGKKESGAAATILGGLIGIFLFVIRVKNPMTYILINLISYFGFCYFNMIIWAMITDIIDDQEVKTGKREDGTIYAVYSFARKIGQALAGGLGGFALELIGYNSLVQVQTEAVRESIYSVSTLAPGIFYLAVGLSLILIYPLNKKRVEENSRLLKREK